MSPEQIAGKHVDGRSDLYSLGVTLFQMLAGTLPFRGESMAELMYKIANEDTPDLRAVRPELPQRLVEIVGRALAKKPELRYQDGDELARDLRALAAAESGAPSAGAATWSAAPAAAPAAASCAPDPEQTVAVSLAARASARTAQPADNGLQAAVPTSALPGYDAAQKESGPAGQVGPGTTPVTNTPGAPDQPRAGGGQAGQEP
jgi:serine/threonine-protein kinase